MKYDLRATLSHNLRGLCELEGHLRPLYNLQFCTTYEGFVFYYITCTNKLYYARGNLIARWLPTNKRRHILCCPGRTDLLLITRKSIWLLAPLEMRENLKSKIQN